MEKIESKIDKIFYWAVFIGLAHYTAHFLITFII